MRKIKYVIASFRNISSETVLYLKEWFIFIIMLSITIISYHIIGSLFNASSCKHIIDKLISVDLSFLALLITIFALLLSQFRKLKKSAEKSKSSYLNEVIKNHIEYDSDILNSFNKAIRFNNRRLYYNIFIFIIISIHFICAVFLGVTNVVAEKIQLTLLFSNLICQLLYFIQFLLLLAKLFCSDKNSLGDEFSFEYANISCRFKINNIEKTDKLNNIYKALRLTKEI